ncbi:unnamed protein product [Cochlearia groenlandica]
MDSTMWKGMIAYWIDPYFVAVVGNCSKSRLTNIDGTSPYVHTSDQHSYVVRHIKMGGGEDELPPIVEVLKNTQKRKDKTYVNA